MKAVTPCGSLVSCAFAQTSLPAKSTRSKPFVKFMSGNRPVRPVLPIKGRSLVALEHLGVLESGMIVAADWNQAAMGYVTFTIFQLDGRVVNMEVLRQN